MTGSGVVAEGDILEGKYRVLARIGEGGMGSVYEGENLRLSKRVAIKVMHASLTKDPDMVARFEREAQAAAAIVSDHIADVIDLGDLPNGDKFMIMEFLEGENLLERLKARGPLAAAEIARIGIELLEGLASVHAAGVIHRDLKPANIFLARTNDGGEKVKILDFGVCKVRGAVFKPSKKEPSTAIGDLLGTLPYMAPERIEHGPSVLDERSDLYSVGVIFYRSLSAKLPYTSTNLFDLLQEMRDGHAPPVREVAPDVDVKLAEIIDRAIEWDPKSRYQDAHELQAALVEWTKGASRIEQLLTDFLDVPDGAEPAPKKKSLPPPPAPGAARPVYRASAPPKKRPSSASTRKVPAAHDFSSEAVTTKRSDDATRKKRR
jgi:serine/threonine-protein kinase